MSLTEFEGRFFDSDDVPILCEAFEDTCRALRFVFLSAKEDSIIAAVRREAATYVMEALERGERHPKKISDLAISRMSPKQATW